MDLPPSRVRTAYKRYLSETVPVPKETLRRHKRFVAAADHQVGIKMAEILRCQKFPRILLILHSVFLNTLHYTIAQ
jgi:hypothetical protein